MKRLFVLVALGFASTVIATPTAAKTPAENYAACVAQRHPAQVKQLLQASSAAAASAPYNALANDDRCFTRTFGDREYRPEDTGLSTDMLRGRLAEQALLPEQARIAALEALPLQAKGYNRAWFAATGRNVAVDQMAACVADTDPAGISALIRTAPGSGGEQSAIAALSPALTRCLTAGARLDASHDALRAALADALYQRVSNAPELSH